MKGIYDFVNTDQFGVSMIALPLMDEARGIPIRPHEALLRTSTSLCRILSWTVTVGFMLLQCWPFVHNQLSFLGLKQHSQLEAAGSVGQK